MARFDPVRYQYLEIALSLAQSMKRYTEVADTTV